jgi:hypothetical protein
MANNNDFNSATDGFISIQDYSDWRSVPEEMMLTTISLTNKFGGQELESSSRKSSKMYSWSCSSCQSC